MKFVRAYHALGGCNSDNKIGSAQLLRTHFGLIKIKLSSTMIGPPLFFFSFKEEIIFYHKKIEKSSVMMPEHCLWLSLFEF